MGDLSQLISKKKLSVWSGSEVQTYSVKGEWGGLREDLVRWFIKQLGTLHGYLSTTYSNTTTVD
jgi:hypothetical protein